MIVQTSSVAEKPPAKKVELQKQAMPNSTPDIEIGLLTGCQDRPYAYGLAMALVSKACWRRHNWQAMILDSPGAARHPEFAGFLNFRGNQGESINFAKKLWKTAMVYYTRLMRYAAHSKPRILHIPVEQQNDRAGV